MNWAKESIHDMSQIILAQIYHFAELISFFSFVVMFIRV